MCQGYHADNCSTKWVIECFLDSIKTITRALFAYSLTHIDCKMWQKSSKMFQNLHRNFCCIQRKKTFFYTIEKFENKHKLKYTLHTLSVSVQKLVILQFCEAWCAYILLHLIMLFAVHFRLSAVKFSLKKQILITKKRRKLCCLTFKTCYKQTVIFFK